MSDLVVANMFQDHAVRSVIINGETWYVAKDIADVLGYSNANQAIKANCEHPKRLCDIFDTLSADSFLNEIKDLTRDWSPTTLLISRPDVSLLISRSQKPEAKKFQAWLFGEVLEDIYDTGSYNSSSTDLSIPTFNDKLFDLISAINAANLKNQEQSRENESKFLEHIRESEIRTNAIQNRFFDMVEKSEANVARLIERSDLEKYEACCNAIFTMFTSVSLEKYLDILKPLVKIENNIRANFTYQNLIKYLQIKKIFKSFGEPYQEYIDLGYYEVSKNQNTSVVNITKKGADHIYSILKSGNNLN